MNILNYKQKLTYNQRSNIRNSQVEEIHIGSSPHVVIADDDNAGGEVAADSNNKEETVDDGEEVKGFIVDMGITKHILDE